MYVSLLTVCNTLENFVHLVATYFKHSLFNSQTQRLSLNAKHQNWCDAFGGPNTTAAAVGSQTKPKILLVPPGN